MTVIYQLTIFTAFVAFYSHIDLTIEFSPIFDTLYILPIFYCQVIIFVNAFFESSRSLRFSQRLAAVPVDAVTAFLARKLISIGMT